MGTKPEDINYRQLLQQQLVKIRKLEAKLEQSETARREPIAIVGMGCRLPGGVESPEAFWELMAQGVDATSEVPPDRWDADALYDPTPRASGKICTRRGAFLRDVAHFDAQFFGLSAREAEMMDPQQRLVLEVAWEALERAGYVVDRGRKDRVGVFVGSMNNDYGQLVLKARGLENIDPFYVGARANCAISGRLSYLFGFQGPSVVVDAACASSLVAVHQACQSLRNGECGMALAAGVNLILFPEASIYLSSTESLSPDGRCKTFDASADGLGRAEACGVLVLERLSDARARGANILAVIRGSAVAHDGPSSAFTVPHGVAQQAVLRQALENAHVEPAEVSYLEAHGTGTSLGDPVEVRAAWSVLKQGRQGGESLWLGSVKTNLGYSEAASGLVGMMKVVLAMRHRKLPPHLHLKRPSPLIDWAEMEVKVPLELTPWEPTQGRRLAGVSTFGRSGTLAHVVLEEAPPRDEVKREVERPEHLLVLSARSAEALQALSARYTQALAEEGVALGDVCFTAAAGRAHFEHRLAVVGDSAARMREQLEAVAAGGPVPGVMQGRNWGEVAKVAFLFGGAGERWEGMGRRLYETQPVFRQALERCEEALKGLLDKPLLQLLYGEGAAPEEGAREAVALFALEWAQAQLWRAWGVRPRVVMGQGVGAYVAAVEAGVFSLEEGLRLAAGRAGSPGEPYASPRLMLLDVETLKLAGREAGRAEYWSRPPGAQAPRWEELEKALRGLGVDVCLQLGPQPARESTEGVRFAWLSTLLRGKDDWTQVLETLAMMYVRGVEVDWVAYDAPYARQRVSLPTYPFQRYRYWYTDAIAREEEQSDNSDEPPSEVNPMSSRLNLLTPEVRANPYPYFAELRRDSPVCQVDPGGLWAVTRYDDAMTVFKNPQLFSSSGFRETYRPAWLQDYPLVDSMLVMDPPNHTRLRALITRAFGPPVLARLDSYVRQFTQELVEQLPVGQSFDLAKLVSARVPPSVMCFLLGVPPSMSASLERWANVLATFTSVGPNDLERQALMRNTVAEARLYFEELLEERRRNPGDDLVSDLLRARVDGEALSQAELMGFLFLLPIGGLETTVNLINHSCHKLMNDPELMTRLRADRSLLPRFMEEMLRTEPPVHGVVRLTTQDVELGGARIPKDSRLVLLLGSINRDEAHFSDPDRFDLDRPGPQNMPFGHGIHFCLGAQLARLEARAAMDALLARFSRFTPGDGPVRYNLSLVVRGLTTLPLVAYTA